MAIKTNRTFKEKYCNKYLNYCRTIHQYIDPDTELDIVVTLIVIQIDNQL